jgi:hypothetical protein
LKRSEDAFGAFTEAYLEGLKVWAVGRYMREMETPLEEVAFLNLIPWRTELVTTRGWRSLVDLGWPILERQLQNLQPKALIILGRTTQGLVPLDARVRIPEDQVLLRGRGDVRTPPETAMKMKALKQRFGW